MRIYDLKGKLIFNGPLSKLQGADLRGANLQEADLQGANLQEADLREANLQEADLRGANLQRANLQRANLRGANLRGANLQGADLRGANLRWVNSQWANLQGASLRGSNLQESDLQEANLREADLRGANLREADLRGANLQSVSTNHTTSYFHLQCPEEGSFIGFKKAQDNFIVKLKVPASALRSSATSRKCRVSEVKVISITKGDESILSCSSYHDSSFIYEVGKVVSVKDFDRDRWNECSTGIHLFITKAEAESY